MDSVRRYYENKESRIGYKLFLRGAQHFGLYPLQGNRKLSEWEAQKRHHDIIFEKLEVRKGEKVYDLGCGRGVIALDLANRYDLRITGVDITPYIIQEANKNSRDTTNKPQFIEGSYQNLPFENSSSDGLYAVETLSHATNLRKALREAYRVLKKNRKVVFFEYMIDSSIRLSSREKLIFSLVRDGSAMHSLSQFKLNSFKNLMEETGFREVRMTNISKEAEKSFKRLYKFAVIPYFFINILQLHKYFINATAAVEYYKLAKKGYLNYVIYEGRK